MQTAGGVEEDHIVAVLLGPAQAGLGDLHGIVLPHLEDGNVELRAHDLQLLDGGGPVHVTGHQQGPLVLGLFEVSGQLRAVGGLARALQADQHDDGRAVGGQIELLVLAAHHGSQLLVDHLDDHLRRVQTLQHIAADAAVGDDLDKVLDDLVADVSLQKGQTNFAHGLLDVVGGQATLAPQTLKGVGQFFS